MKTHTTMDSPPDKQVPAVRTLVNSETETNKPIPQAHTHTHTHKEHSSEYRSQSILISKSCSTVLEETSCDLTVCISTWSHGLGAQSGKVLKVGQVEEQTGEPQEAERQLWMISSLPAFTGGRRLGCSNTAHRSPPPL